MTIKAKLAAVFAVMISLIAASSFVALNQAAKANDEVSFITEDLAAKQRLTLQMRAHAAQTISLIKSYMLAETSEEVQAITEAVDAEIALLEEEIPQVRNFLQSGASVEDLDQFQKEWTQFLKVEAELRNLAGRDSLSQARTLSSTGVTPAFEGMMAGLDNVIAPARQRLRQASARDPNLVALEAALDAAMDDVRAMQATHLDMLAYPMAGPHERARETIGEARTAFISRLRQAQSSFPGGDQQPIDEIERAWTTYDSQINEFVDVVTARSHHRAITILNEDLNPAFLEAFEIAQRMASRANELMNEARATTNVLHSSTTRVLIFVGALAGVIGLGAAIWLSTSISRGLTRAVAVVKDVARGDLDVDTSTKSKDEIATLLTEMGKMVTDLKGMSRAAESIAEGNLRADVTPRSEKDRLGLALRNMVVKLREVISNASSNATYVADGASKMSSTAKQLSAGSNSQASAAEEASASIEEMTANISQNADNASQTEKIANQSADDAKRSGEAVDNAVRAMKTIADKINIIQEIARQTDLLALNAAVEAARAGSHGKGFAVVASEVRKLAERSQQAAAEISQLSTETVDVSGEAGRMLETLVPNIQRTADLVQEISASTREQNVGAEQINQAIRDLDRVIQQNAAAAEESAATSQELASQSDELTSVISYFDVGTVAAKAKGKTKPRPSPRKSVSASALDQPATDVEAFDLDLAAEDVSDENFQRYAG